MTIYSFSTGDVAMGSLKTFEIGDLNFETTYYFAVNAFDFRVIFRRFLLNLLYYFSE